MFLNIRDSGLKVKHDFRDTINPVCPTSDWSEDMEHFLLLCPSFDLQGRDLFAGIVELLRPFVQIARISNDALTQRLLYCDQHLSNYLNKYILKLTVRSSTKLVGLIDTF